MANLNTTYLGLELRSPIIVGSSGMTHNLANLVKAEEAGAGAVVLKSLFEEHIKYEIHKTIGLGIQTPHNDYPEAMDYISAYSKDHHLNEYLELIRQAKKALRIPVIASINCMTASEWIDFAKSIEDAGADALELNVFILPSDPTHQGTDTEEVYFEIASKVLQVVKIPVSMKISFYFSGLARFVKRLSWTGLKSLVLFNRFFSPDIDIEDLKIVASHVFSSPDELPQSLRWIAMLSEVVHCDLCASTGIHDGKAVAKQLLAGAKAVQVASVIYKDGFQAVTAMNNELSDWMDRKGYAKIDDFRGKMSFKETENPAAYERVQFMRHFAGIE
jgi:dihydroorotate dehydrogenase (fumarate)